MAVRCLWGLLYALFCAAGCASYEFVNVDESDAFRDIDYTLEERLAARRRGRDNTFRVHPVGDHVQLLRKGKKVDEAVVATQWVDRHSDVVVSFDSVAQDLLRQAAAELELARTAEPAESKLLIESATRKVDRVGTMRQAASGDEDEFKVSVEAFVTPRKGPAHALSIRGWNLIGSEKLQQEEPEAEKGGVPQTNDLKRKAAALTKADDVAEQAVAVRNELARTRPNLVGFAVPAARDLQQIVGMCDHCVESLDLNEAETLRVTQLKEDAVRAQETEGARAALNAKIEVLETVPGGFLPRAVIHLRDMTLNRGDRISVRVRFTEPKAAGAPEGQEPKLLYESQYVLEAEDLGFYGEVSPLVVFARASRGAGRMNATDWQFAAAAAVNWHYRYRETYTAGRRFWNWLNPGAGIHLAALNQEADETVEFGIGLNVALWDGLLNAGYGYNLAADRGHEYFYVGIDLLDVLDLARKQASKRQE